jgi:hypothetical protein
MLTISEKYVVSHMCPDQARVTETAMSHVSIPEALGPYSVFDGLGFVVRRTSTNLPKLLLSRQRLFAGHGNRPVYA